MFFTDINLITVIVAAVISIALGFVWYAPWFFGSTSLLSSTRGWKAYVGSAVTTLITAFFIASLLNSIVVLGLSGIVMAGFVVWLGFMAPVRVNDYFYGRMPRGAVLVDLGYGLVSTLLMALVIGLFS
ncbi:MAG: DUF1761 domain-containing protein [bacterium]|nr:DUF1761 domain-containing protein [bacterium]